VITAAEAKKATAAIATLVATDIQDFPPAAFAIVPAPAAADAPVKTVVWIAIDWRAELKFSPFSSICTMLTIFVDLIVNPFSSICTMLTVWSLWT
jgi:hypothetical protein